SGSPHSVSCASSSQRTSTDPTAAGCTGRDPEYRLIRSVVETMVLTIGLLRSWQRGRNLEVQAPAGRLGVVDKISLSDAGRRPNARQKSGTVLPLVEIMILFRCQVVDLDAERL